MGDNADAGQCRAFRIAARGDANVVELPIADLTPGDVLIRVEYSSINYKDALAATGASPILRTYPLNGGIDAAGEVLSSADERYAPGQKVVVTGSGLSETRDGGYATHLRIDGDEVIPLPEGVTPFEAMQLGTAGFTAGLAVHRMELTGQTPALGPIAVSGASGGVGSLAVDMLAGAGYEVMALSSKAEAVDWLTGIGAKDVLSPAGLDLPGKPLEAARLGGAIDNVGGDLLAWMIASTAYGGSVASIGLAASHKLSTTVMPFILRGVSLLGVNSVETPRELRLAVWSRLFGDLRPRHLDKIAHRTVSFDNLPNVFGAYMDGKVTGRTVVAIGD
ncbi:MAG: acryloyl-CoA reductase [Pseudomonadota bacterium]